MFHESDLRRVALDSCVTTGSGCRPRYIHTSRTEEYTLFVPLLYLYPGAVDSLVLANGPMLMSMSMFMSRFLGIVSGMV